MRPPAFPRNSIVRGSELQVYPKPRRAPTLSTWFPLGFMEFCGSNILSCHSERSEALFSIARFLCDESAFPLCELDITYTDIYSPANPHKGDSSVAGRAESFMMVAVRNSYGDVCVELPALRRGGLTTTPAPSCDCEGHEPRGFFSRICKGLAATPGGTP